MVCADKREHEKDKSQRKTEQHPSFERILPFHLPVEPIVFFSIKTSKIRLLYI